MKQILYVLGALEILLAVTFRLFQREDSDFHRCACQYAFWDPITYY